MIILFGGEKGGTGKTTLAINIACLAAQDGGDLLVVDADKQRSAATFFGLRQENEHAPEIPCVEKRGKILGRDLKSLSQKYDLIIVDAGGQDSLELRAAMIVADEIYIPFQPSQADLWTLDKMNDLLSEVHMFNEELKAFAVLNRCSSNPRNTDAEEASRLFEDYVNITIMDKKLKDRVIYQRAVRTGQSVPEYDPKDSGALEIQDLYKAMMY